MKILTKMMVVWSIERKRLSHQCSDKTNWSASINSLGGTPGLENSIVTTVTDISAPIVTNYTVQGDTLLTFEFDEDIVLMATFGMTVTPQLKHYFYGNIYLSILYLF